MDAGEQIDMLVKAGCYIYDDKEDKRVLRELKEVIKGKSIITKGIYVEDDIDITDRVIWLIIQAERQGVGR